MSRVCGNHDPEQLPNLHAGSSLSASTESRFSKRSYEAARPFVALYAYGRPGCITHRKLTPALSRSLQCPYPPRASPRPGRITQETPYAQRPECGPSSTVSAMTGGHQPCRAVRVRTECTGVQHEHVHVRESDRSAIETYRFRRKRLDW